MFIDRRLIAQFDWPLLFLSLLLPLLGLFVLYSAGYDPDLQIVPFSFEQLTIQSHVFLKQLRFLVVALFGMSLGMMTGTRTWYRFSYFLYAGCVLLLIGVLAFGAISHGSRRWLSFGSFNLQPSELVKLGVVLGMARYIAKHPPKKRFYGFRELIVPSLLFGVPMGLIFLQPDLGTALSVGAIGFAMLLFVGIRPKLLLGFSLLGIFAAVASWFWVLHDYQKRRVLVLFDPESNPRGEGWQIIQSKIAVGSGELFGKGYLQGSQTQLEFLPERTTDFVFCVLAEEWGFVGSLLVIGLFALLMYRLLRVVAKSKDLYSALVVFGIAVFLFFHVLVNLGMVVGLFPVVGLPLPLLSYGGSSLLTVMFCLGIVLGMSMRKTVFSAS
ncbi:MAG: rod shape-determining protein RodA [Bdellovibrionales bacterium]|nr:rod shape-determining protein RodA [Bdellovibrionales bacterium]